jgi:hypothetical protein
MNVNPKDPSPLLTPHALGFEPKKKPVDPEEEPEVEPEPEPDPVYVDPFIEEIDKIRLSQSPAVRDTIERAKCFGRSWYIDPALETESDPDEGGICQQFECDLRALCELVYQRATKTKLVQKKEEEPMTAAERFVKRRENKKNKRKSPEGMYERHPYVSTDRPVDKIALALWHMVGAPPAMPDHWNYPPARNKEQRAHARRLFIDNFGDGITVSRRITYHQYFRDGAHWMRFWVRHPGGGWLDFTSDLAVKVMKHCDLKLENCSRRALRQPHRFYPYRVYVSRQRHLNRLAKVFEAMGIEPHKPGHEPTGDE